jgi:phosphoribosylamine--glycine ligase
VVEFNARFGDPETQVVLDRLASPLAEMLQACAIGGLDPAFRPAWHQGAAVTVVVAAEGYPASPVKGDVITGIEDAERVPGAYVLHAGTALDGEGRLVASGGRVLNVVGSGPDLTAARAAAYEAVGRIGLRGAHHRTDIALEAAQAAGPA